MKDYGNMRWTMGNRCNHVSFVRKTGLKYRQSMLVQLCILFLHSPVTRVRPLVLSKRRIGKRSSHLYVQHVMYGVDYLFRP